MLHAVQLTGLEPVSRRWGDCRLADPLAVALAHYAVPLALARRKALRLADVLSVALAQAGADELVALREAVPVPRFSHPRRPHLCANKIKQRRCTPCYMSERNKIHATTNSTARAS